MEDIDSECLRDSERRHHDETKGRARFWSGEVLGRTSRDALVAYPDHDGEPSLRGLVAVDWDAMDAWFEEDEQVFSHARDPFHRVGVLQSSRHVTVELEGEVLADTRRPLALFETKLPPRWYIPKLDVRMDLLTAAAGITTCPYKGVANYFEIRAGGKEHSRLVWEYRSPIPEVTKIAHHVCFLDERVDVVIDGERRRRPATSFLIDHAYNRMTEASPA